MHHNAPLITERDELLRQARAKIPGTRITAYQPTGETTADEQALRNEITELRGFIDRPPPGLHTDTYDENWDGENVDPTNT